MEAPRPDRASLSRELNEFLIELSIALHRHSMYPLGHPALDPAIAGVVRRAEKLLHDRTTIAFGVARRQLIIDGVTTDSEQPVLRRLAETLHGHHLGAISIHRGVDANELGEALLALSVEADAEGAMGKGPLPSWPHVKLHGLSFDGLTLVDDSGSSGGSAESSRGSELWIGLAQAALAGDAPRGEAANAEPSAVAKAIDEHERAEAYDQVIIGYLLQIARELKTATGDTAEELRRRTSRLISSLRPGTLRRLVEMGGNQVQREQFVLDAASGMAVDAVLEIVKAAADASGQTISHGLVRMLSKLASHAERGTDLARSRADVELREQVSRLLEDWRLEDPNPEAYGMVLEHLATSTAGGANQVERAVAAGPDPVRILQMSLEAGAFGPLADKALDQALHTGRLNAVLELVSSPPPGAEAGAETILTRLIRPETLKDMLASDRIDMAGLDNLLPRLSLESYEPLLEALGSSPSRTTRRRLLDLLGRTSVDITPLVIPRLDDPRWYVQRNMLMLLSRSRHVPETFSALKWTTHPDQRVRTEAIRLQLMMPHERDLGVRVSLTDPDPRVVHLGLMAIRDECPPDLIDKLVDLALSPDSTEDVRLLAVTSIGAVREPSVLGALLHLADGGRSFFGRLRLPPKSPVLIAVIRALANTWPDDPFAASVLSAALRSSDAEVRDAASPLPT